MKQKYSRTINSIWEKDNKNIFIYYICHQIVHVISCIPLPKNKTQSKILHRRIAQNIDSACNAELYQHCSQVNLDTMDTFTMRH